MLSLLGLGRLHDEGLVDVWDDTTTSDSGLDQSVKLLVTSDCKLEMSWCDSLDFKVLGCVTCEFEDLSGQVLKNGSAVDC